MKAMNNKNALCVNLWIKNIRIPANNAVISLKIYAFNAVNNHLIKYKINAATAFINL